MNFDKNTIYANYKNEIDRLSVSVIKRTRKVEGLLVLVRGECSRCRGERPL